MNGIPSPSTGVWYLGPLPIRAYAIAILLGIVIGGWIWSKRYRAKGGPEGATLDILMWAVPFGIIGARIYHVFSSPDAYFGPDGDPWRAFLIWEGGLGIWGAVPAGAFGAWLGARRMGLRLGPLADTAAPGLLVAQAIGRLGNYFNQELFGAPTTLPWGLQIDADVLRAQGMDYPAGTLFHPTFLYELLWNLGVAAILVWAARRFQLRHGRVFWLYVALYTLGRVWVELLRIDEAEQVLGLRLNVWTSILVFAVAVAVFVVIGRRTAGAPDPIWIPGREPEDDEHDDESDDADADESDVVVDDEARSSGAAEGDGTDEPEPAASGDEAGADSDEEATEPSNSATPPPSRSADRRRS